MKKLSLAYFGTPDFSARFLEKILNDKDLPVEVKLVVTQEDKPVGRKQVVTKSPVKVIAEKYTIPVTDRPLDTQFFDSMSVLVPAHLSSRKKLVSVHPSIDLAVLFAYGEIIPEDILEVPKHGFWNIHPSLLPKYRGASPVAFPLVNGDKETGVTIIQMDKDLDHGPIITQEKVKILPSERRPELTSRLTDVGFELFKNVILGSEATPESGKRDSGQARMTVKTVPQDHSRATYTKLLTKKDGFVEFLDLKSKIVNHPQELFNMFRGLYPWPGLWTTIRFKNKDLRLKITDMDLVNGRLIIKKVQLEGKNESNFEQFKKVYL